MLTLLEYKTKKPEGYKKALAEIVRRFEGTKRKCHHNDICELIETGKEFIVKINGRIYGKQQIMDWNRDGTDFTILTFRFPDIPQ